MKSYTIIPRWSRCGRSELSFDLQEWLSCKRHENSHKNLLLESHYPLARKWRELSHPFILIFKKKKSSFPLTYNASISQVARKELPRNVQRFRDLFLKKTHIVSQRDRMISSFLVLLLCSTPQRPSLRWQKRRRECVDISTRPCLLLARENSFWTVLLLLRSFLIVKIWTQQGTDFYLKKCVFSLNFSWRSRVCFSNEHYSISTWLFSLKIHMRSCNYFVIILSHSRRTVLAKQAKKRLDLLELLWRKMQRTEWKICCLPLTLPSTTGRGTVKLADN